MRWQCVGNALAMGQPQKANRVSDPKDTELGESPQMVGKFIPEVVLFSRGSSRSRLPLPLFGFFGSAAQLFRQLLTICQRQSAVQELAPSEVRTKSFLFFAADL